ncbi:hypothetical protein LMG26840_04815 [Achromobacter dolens]|nr:hypothetical protein LMG26840_04815 [Achromobacter dolens]
MAARNAASTSAQAPGRRAKRARVARRGAAAGAGKAASRHPSAISRLKATTAASSVSATPCPSHPASTRQPGPPAKKPTMVPPTCTALARASAWPSKRSAVRPSVAMSWVALASEARAIRPTTQGALAAAMPVMATATRQASTTACIGRIQLRRRPSAARQRLSTCGAHRNFSTQGSPTSGSQASACRGAPSRRSSVGNASMATPSGMPWEKYSAPIMTNRRAFAVCFTSISFKLALPRPRGGVHCPARA